MHRVPPFQQHQIGKHNGCHDVGPIMTVTRMWLKHKLFNYCLGHSVCFITILITLFSIVIYHIHQGPVLDYAVLRATGMKA